MKQIIISVALLLIMAGCTSQDIQATKALPTASQEKIWSLLPHYRRMAALFRSLHKQQRFFQR